MSHPKTRELPWYLAQNTPRSDPCHSFNNHDPSFHHPCVLNNPKPRPPSVSPNRLAVSQPNNNNPHPHADLPTQLGVLTRSRVNGNRETKPSHQSRIKSQQRKKLKFQCHLNRKQTDPTTTTQRPSIAASRYFSSWISTDLSSTSITNPKIALQISCSLSRPLPFSSQKHKNETITTNPSHPSLSPTLHHHPIQPNPFHPSSQPTNYLSHINHPSLPFRSPNQFTHTTTRSYVCVYVM